MGEPFRAHSTSEDTLAAWFRGADRNHDGELTVDEMVADAERFFATLDTNHDGQIDPDELNQYEWEVAPEIQVNSRTRRRPGEQAPAPSKADDDAAGRDGPRRKSGDEEELSTAPGGLQGAARYSLLNIPEPVAAADADFNRAVSLQEFRAAAIERFQLLDTAHRGRIKLGELQELRRRVQEITKAGRHRDDGDTRLGNPVPEQP
jgi:Ca2+-binding EF-hand superfamily protein